MQDIIAKNNTSLTLMNKTHNKLLKVKSILYFLVFMVVASNASAHDKDDCTKSPQLNPLVDVGWLKQNLNNDNLIVIDASVKISMTPEGLFNISSGKPDFDKNHIPNARFADLLGDFSASSELNFIMPSSEQIQKAISDLGISNNSRVVIYSTKPTQSWAQRLWWMLYWAGHDDIAILDGGLTAWTDEDFAVSDKPANFAKTNYKIHLRPEIIASHDEVYKAIDDKKTTLIDALPASSYNGQYAMYPRLGHIKSAINVPTGQMHTESGHYKTNDELKKLFNSNLDSRIISYCGGGVAASSTAFTLHRLGYKDVAVYMGSLQEWTADESNPMSVEH